MGPFLQQEQRPGRRHMAYLQGLPPGITNDTNARAEAVSAFRVYQNSIRVYLGSRQILLGY